ncbi:hypothetical protein GCM10010302_22070 [Streptomyces polychromogenes]|uniref:DUF916 domain-containing protein n=1 Tax=Streptomyces polychromogenes TaxID=67342 RepID=A0ABN0VAJ1_9ACTN
MRCRATVLRTLLLGLCGLLLLPARLSAAADNGTWGVFPTPPAGAAMTDRAYFFHQGPAGAAVTDSVTILNSSGRELTFRVFATDAMNTPSGGAFALLPAETKPRDVGAWIALGPEAAGTVTVPPKGRKDIPFTVRVPQDASPGDHVGGIVAQNTEIEGIQREGKVQVGVKRQVGARLYLRVPGPLTPAVSVEDVRVSRGAPLLPWTKDAHATITYTLVNRGNAVLEPKVAVSARGLFGRRVLDLPARAPRQALLPGQRIVLTEPWPDSPQLDRVNVKVTVSAPAYPDVGSEAGTAFLAVPWPALGALLLLVGAGVAVLVALRRRRVARHEAEPVPDLARAR